MNKEELLKELNNYELKVKELKEKLLSNYKDFDIWYRCSEKEDYQLIVFEKDAPYLIKFLRQFELRRYKTIDLNHILALIEDTISNSPEDNFIRDSIKKELMNLNFGSMVYDW